MISFLGAGPLLGHATVTINTVAGASRYDDSDNNSLPIVYGGNAGTLCTTTSGTDTCSNCGSTLTACNPTRIYDSLQLRITFTVAGNFTGTGTAKLTDTSGNILSTGISFDPSQVSAGGTATATINWGSLCAFLSDAGTCEGTTITSSSTIRIGADFGSTTGWDSGEYAELSIIVVGADMANTTDLCGTAGALGICDFAMQPGDRKVRLIPEESQTFPDLSNVSLKAVRVFYSEGGNFASALPGGTSTDLSVDANNGISERITDLKNDVTYYFRLGLVDAAGNVGLFTSDTAIQNKPGCALLDDATCDYMATPGEVVGLLQDDFNCFIATAAYGSALHPRLRTLREFRNRYLLPYAWGRRLNAVYYEFGPRVARWIAETPERRATARVVLWPLWLLAWILMNGGLWGMAALMVAGLAVLGFFRLGWRRIFLRSRSQFFFLVLGLLGVLLFSANRVEAKTGPATAGEVDAEDFELESEVPHPGAREGLIRIDRDRVYFYRIPTSEQKNAAALRVGSYSPQNLANQQGDPFDSIYGGSSPVLILFDYEWQLWRNGLGKLGLKAGLGLLVASGNGVFSRDGSAAFEEFTFLVFPVTGAAVYRLQMWDRQPLVPFAEAGLDLIPFAERRDDGLNPTLGARYGGSLAAHFAGGAALRIGGWGRESKARLDAEYGVNELWIFAELRQLIHLANEFDFSGTMVGGGLLVEF